MQYLVVYCWPNYKDHDKIAKECYQKVAKNIDALDLGDNCAFCLCRGTKPLWAKDLFLLAFVESTRDGSATWRRLLKFFKEYDCTEPQELEHLPYEREVNVDNLVQLIKQNGLKIVKGPVVKKL